MTRNNQERLSVDPPIQSDSLLMPSQETVCVKLPSKGMFYDKNHPWYNKTSVEIKLMTIFHQDIITNKSYNDNKIVFDKLLENLLVDKVNIDSILSGDKDALVLAARIDGYGEDYQYSTICPKCGKKIEDTCSLETILENSVNRQIKLNEEYELTKDGFKITLPFAKKEVEIRFLTGGDFKNIEIIQEKLRRHNQPEKRTFCTLQHMIKTVEGDKPTDIFIASMKPRDANFINKIYSELAPVLDSKIKVKCQNTECGFQYDSVIDLSVGLFWIN